MSNVMVTPNANFTSVGGSVAPEFPSQEYLEYRRCWMENPVNFILRDMPLHLDIEASSKCNLRCTFCDRQPNLKDGQRGFLEMPLFRHIIDQFSGENKLWGMKLSYRGEPMLNPDIPEMVSYAKAQGVLDVYFNTNGMFLSEMNCESLVDARLDRISISIDGTNKEQYESVRIGASFDRLLDGLHNLWWARKKKRTTYPKIRIQTVKLPGINAEDYIETWKKYADEIAMLEFTDESKRDTSLRGNWACPQLWQRMTIEWDGTVLGCNNDDLRQINLGNAWERSIYDCWHDERLMEIRRLHMEGKSHEVEDCNGCPWRTAQMRKAFA